jgi:uncharacterized protein
MRELNDSQKKRVFQDHVISVVKKDGKLVFKSEDIVTPKGLKKENKLISVAPDSSENVVSVNEVKYLFKELKQMNIILTNACNLSCTYCYEQHNKDFGRFTEESLLKIYRFLATANERQRKVFDFFGGEPLIHKDLILNFIRNNKEELERNSMGDFNTVVGMTTNGLLITPELIDEYLSYKFTYFLISLDTDRATVDHREIGQDGIQHILDMISYMPQSAKDEQRVTIRTTLARENAPYLTEFIDNLYARGIKRMVVHPLVLDSKLGFIHWEEQLWNNLHRDIVSALDKYQDFTIHFAEGVGQKGEENCMIGADMIAMDASGDFSGCYFFTNQKANGADGAILGNLYEDKIYIDRYKNFQKIYAQMFEEEEQCKTCNYKNACYQCPAGNLDTGSGKMFRPDSMCQNIVKLFLDLKEDVATKQFRRKYESIVKAIEVEGENTAMVKGLMYMLFYFHFNYHPKPEVVHTGIEGIEYKKLLGLFVSIIKTGHRNYTQNNFVSQIKNDLTDDEIAIDYFYYYLLEKGKLAPTDNKAKGDTPQARAFFLTLLHMILLQNSHATYEGTFSERLIKG